MMLGLALSVCSGGNASRISVVAAGESLTFGSGSSSPGGATSYPAVFAGLKGLTYDGTVLNVGVSGIGIDDVPNVDHRLVPGARNHLVIMEGLNDISEGPYSANMTNLYNAVMAYAAARAANGWVITLCTLTATSAFNGTQQTNRTTYNNLIRANGTYPVIDVAANANIGDGATIPGSYFSDNIHLNDAGYALLASIISSGINLNRTAAAAYSNAYGPGTISGLTWWGTTWTRANNLTRKAFDVFNNATAHATAAPYLTADNATPADVPTVATNGSHRVIRFPGAAGVVGTSGFYGSASAWSALITTTTAFLVAVVSIDAIATNNADPRDNDGLFDDAAGFIGLYLKGTAGAYSAVAAAHNGVIRSVGASVSLATKTLIMMRIHSGQLGIKVGAAGSWTETTFTGAVGSLAGPFRVGTSSTSNRRFDGDLFDSFAVSAWSSAAETALITHLQAKHGGAL